MLICTLWASLFVLRADFFFIHCQWFVVHSGLKIICAFYFSKCGFLMKTLGWIRGKSPTFLDCTKSLMKFSVSESMLFIFLWHSKVHLSFEIVPLKLEYWSLDVIVNMPVLFTESQPAAGTAQPHWSRTRWRLVFFWACLCVHCLKPEWRHLWKMKSWLRNHVCLWQLPFKAAVLFMFPGEEQTHSVSSPQLKKRYKSSCIVVLVTC